MPFGLLGPLQVVHGGRSVPAPVGKRGAVLAVLLLHDGRSVPAERLIDELWGERPPATAAKTLQVHVSQLRKTLRESGGPGGADVLVTRGAGYAVELGPDDLDVRVFERAVAEGKRRLGAGDPVRAADVLERGLRLWRGPALADFAYEPFAQAEIARLEELRLVAHETQLEAQLALGRHAELVGPLEGLVAAHPLRERLREHLMLALYRCGRQAEALDVYRDTRRLLSEELGLEPTPPLRALHQRILEQDAGLATPAAPAPRAPRRAPVRERPAAAPEPVTVRRRRGSLLLLSGAAILAAAVAAAAWQRAGDPGAAAGTPVLDLGPNSLVEIDVGRRRVASAVPLPGRPTDVAVAGRTVWAVSVDIAALTGLDLRTGKILRTVPLGGVPDAVAADAHAVWVADARRGLLRRVRPGYGTVQRTVRYPAGGGRSTWRGRRRLAHSGLAVTRGAVWVANGFRHVLRVDADSGQVDHVATGLPVDDLVSSGAAVWALSAGRPTVLRIDPAARRVAARVPLAARGGGDAHSPVALAAGRRTVWVLNGNTATVTSIDASTGSVLATVPVGAERVPNDIAAAGDTAWVANGDGSVVQLARGSWRTRELWVGESLEEIAADGRRVWVTTTALDQQLPGGVG